MLAAALDPMITIDAMGTIQAASNSVFRVFGYAPEELAGKNINVLMPEPHHSAHDGYLSNYRRTGQTNILGRTREFEAVRRNGERFPIELSVSRVEVPAGGLPLFVGIIRDVTERMRLERELRLLKDLALSITGARDVSEALTKTLELIGLATAWDYGEVWEPTTEGRELTGCASWLRPGSGLEAFAGTMERVRFTAGDGLAGRAWESGRSVWIGDLGAVGEPEFSRADAARRAGLRAAAAVPITSEERVTAVLLFFVRATRSEDLHLLELVRAAVAPLGTLIQRKRAEGELEEYRRRLEERVEERTRALQESQDRLRVADRLASIGTLAAGLGHDMNNVLLPVRAHLNALRAAPEGKRRGTGGKPGGTDVRRHIEQIGKGVAYLQQLADGLHFLALDPETDADSRGGGESTELRGWWGQTGVLISKSVPKHVQVRASIPTGLPTVRVAAHRLTQAVLNLVVNAGEAIPSPAERVRRQGIVRVWAERGADGTVRLGVTDNGRGMSDEVKRRAFEMFFTTKVRGLGTGLGLSLVHKVAYSAGGSIEVESKVGQGTTIVLTLPVGPAAGTATSGAAPTAAVTLRDGRAAAMVRQVLEAGGARLEEDPARADVWVVAPVEADPRAAREWRKRRPGARLVLLGRPAEGAEASWRDLDPVIIENPDDFPSVRAALGLALSS